MPNLFKEARNANSCSCHLAFFQYFETTFCHEFSYVRYRIDTLNHERRDTALVAAELSLKGTVELMKETGNTLVYFYLINFS